MFSVKRIYASDEAYGEPFFDDEDAARVEFDAIPVLGRVVRIELWSGSLSPADDMTRWVDGDLLAAKP